MRILTKRIYEGPSPDDATRVLVDRLWPRGVSKEEAELDDWMQEIAPSNELREWFDHDRDKWQEFQRRYRAELDEKDELVMELQSAAKLGRLTLLYAASDEDQNNAVVLKEHLQTRR